MSSRSAVIVTTLVLLASCSNSGTGGAPGDTGGDPSAVTGSESTDAGGAETTDAAPETVPASSAPPPTTTIPDPEPEPLADPMPCPDDFGADIECSTVEVPADRTDPDGGTVVLPVAVAPALDPAGGGGAIVVPAGGPGFAGLGMVLAYLDSPLRQSHDIVAFDQRGTGRAEPNLECPERDSAAIATLQTADPAGVERGRVVEAMIECRQRLVESGVDLEDYDSEANAADLDDLRRSLGYDRWSILGISYGARLALATMRSFPDGLESVVLDSVYDVVDGGLAATVAAAGRGVDHLAAACAADPQCGGRYPDLAGTIEAVRALYNAVPWQGEVQIDGATPVMPFTITGDDIIAGLFQALYDATLIPLLPSIIVALRDGDTSILPVFVEQSVPGIVDVADAMALSFDCADNAGVPGVDDRDAASVAAAEAGDRFSTVVTLAYTPLCEDWGVAPTSADFNRPVVSSVPSLALAGSFDPITPPAGTEAAALALGGAPFALFPDAGHGVTGSGECQTAMTLAFLADPTAPVDTTCVAGVPGPAWV